MTLIEKAKELIAMGENYEDAWAKYEEMTTPGDLLPLLRLLVECERGLEQMAEPQEVDYLRGSKECACSKWRIGTARALLDKLRSES